jgi:hypothetical protein
MGKISGDRMVPLLSQVIDSPLQIGRVPQNDGGDEQIQTARAVALILIRAVADFAESVEEHGAAKRILLLTLVETDVTATTQFGILQPLQRKQCSLQLSRGSSRMPIYFAYDMRCWTIPT